MTTPVAAAAPAGWLPEVAGALAHKATLNRGGAIAARGVVMHYTAGRSAQNTIRRFCDPASRVSAQFVVHADGMATQLVSCRRRAWHAGESMWRLPSGEVLRQLNGCTIGIELDYDGWLADARSGRRVYLPSELISVPGQRRVWPVYPEVQLRTAARLIRECIAAGYLPSDAFIVGHSDIAPGRKLDPGPAFPWSAFRAMVAAPDLERAPW